MPFSFKKFLVSVLLAGSVLSSNSCAVKDALYTPSEADRQFIKITKEELRYEVIVKQSGKTLWIYVPGARDIFKIKPSGKPSAPAARPFSVEYADGRFEDRQFILEYDIIPATKPPKPNTVATGYSTEFTEEYGKITGAIGRVYLNTQEPPEFIVTVFADTKNGIEVVNTIYTLDLRQYYSSSVPYEEYLLRVLSETNGNPEIINDTTGQHLPYLEVALSDFLARQITNRVAFKFQQSDFPPKNSIPQELLAIVQSTVHAYDFSDFDALKLHDVRSQAQETFNREQVLTAVK